MNQGCGYALGPYTVTTIIGVGMALYEGEWKWLLVSAFLVGWDLLRVLFFVASSCGWAVPSPNPGHGSVDFGRE